MDVFAEGIIKYDKSKTEGIHNIKMNLPLPIGSAIKLSRLCLHDDDQPTAALLDRLRRELFIDLRLSPWSKDGIFVHVIAAPTIVVPPATRMRKLLLHLVRKESLHLVERQDEYEWWHLTDAEKDLMNKKELTWN